MSAWFPSHPQPCKHVMPLFFTRIDFWISTWLAQATAPRTMHTVFRCGVLQFVEASLWRTVAYFIYRIVWLRKSCTVIGALVYFSSVFTSRFPGGNVCVLLPMYENSETCRLSVLTTRNPLIAKFCHKCDSFLAGWTAYVAKCLGWYEQHCRPIHSCFSTPFFWNLNTLLPCAILS